MFNFFITALVLFTASLNAGSSQKGLIAGDVTPRSNYSDEDAMDDYDSDSTGEVDEDVIIDDEENTNDDEGVNN